jgi:predicted transcriptional regulator
VAEGDVRGIEEVRMKCEQLMNSLPATMDELVAVLESKRHRVNALLQFLKKQGKVRKTDNKVSVEGKKGRKGSIWEKV